MVCGPKCSFFCLFISAWAVIQLTLMGIFFLLNSMALIDDLPLTPIFHSLEDFRAHADVTYQVVAIRCFVTALLYLCFGILSICCIKRNRAKERRALESSLQR
ncbi:ribonuclease kappa [Drosophila miranda]|uniref:ribonuclease kappa n=1 Tax=Drosophila miranda TaxID=7229 RepID=UPI0007E87D6D|nr:ribonuclease kappa [Drosophila miranda]